MAKKKEKVDSQEKAMNLLNTCYDKCLEGIPKVSLSVEELALDYLDKYDTKEKACKAMLKKQVIKCTTSGTLAGLGGIITLPVAVPANISSVLYVQMRMIACAAYMFNYNLEDDETRTFIYACLAGVSVSNIVKKAGIEFGTKYVNALIKRIPGTVFTQINQKVGFRFITKFGETGIINLGKLVPGVGGVFGGAFDLLETKMIANRAYRWFCKNDFSNEKENFDNEDVIIDINDDELI